MYLVLHHKLESYLYYYFVLGSSASCTSYTTSYNNNNVKYSLWQSTSNCDYDSLAIRTLLKPLTMSCASTLDYKEGNWEAKWDDMRWRRTQSFPKKRKYWMPYNIFPNSNARWAQTSSCPTWKTTTGPDRSWASPKKQQKKHLEPPLSLNSASTIDSSIV